MNSDLGLTPDDKEFHLQVAIALSDCQYVEFLLKHYIARAFDHVRQCLNGTLPFDYHGDQFEDTPLGGLINTFKKLSDNRDLVTRLQTFKTRRDQLAHRAFFDKLRKEELGLPVDDPGHPLAELTSLQRDAASLHLAVMTEYLRHFGDRVAAATTTK